MLLGYQRLSILAIPQAPPVKLRQSPDEPVRRNFSTLALELQRESALAVVAFWRWNEGSDKTFWRYAALWKLWRLCHDDAAEPAESR
jgi:hypothetical protein